MADGERRSNINKACKSIFGTFPPPGAREWRWIAAALLATIYCVWVSIGIGGKSLLWALSLCAVGVPVYWWYAYARRDAVAAGA